jgi:hypothetical protein
MSVSRFLVAALGGLESPGAAFRRIALGAVETFAGGIRVSLISTATASRSPSSSFLISNPPATGSKQIEKVQLRP